MNIRSVWEVPDDKSIIGARYIQDGHSTLVNLIGMNPGLTWELLGRCTIFSCRFRMWTWRMQAWRCWPPSCQRGGKDAWERKRDGVLMTSFDSSLQQVLPQTFKLYAPMHSFWVGESVHGLQVKESYRFTHWPQGVLKDQESPLGKKSWMVPLEWDTQDSSGRCGNVLLLKQNSMYVDLCMFLFVPCMYEKSHDTNFF